MQISSDSCQIATKTHVDFSCFQEPQPSTLPTQYFSQPLRGTIIPSSWKTITTRERKKLSRGALELFAIIVSWFNPRKIKNLATGQITFAPKFEGDELRKNYNYFTRELDRSQEQVRRYFVELKAANLIAMELRTVWHKNWRYPNTICIKLNKDAAYFTNKQDADINIPDEKSCSVKDLARLPEAKKIWIPPHKKVDFTPQKSGVHIKSNYFKTKHYRSRSDESNFDKKIDNNDDINQQQPTKPKNQDLKCPISRKTITGFYPLEENDINILNSSANREFSKHFVNQLIERLAAKYPKHSFISKDTFMKYMVKVLENELRQAPQVNNENFKFKGNEKESAREKYFEEVENSTCITAEAQFKRMVIGALEPETAYRLLMGTRIFQQDSEIIFRTPKSQVFDNNINSKLLESARHIYGKQIQQISIIAQEEANSLSATSGFCPREKDQGLRQGIWSKIREGLIKRFGEGADKSWFSRVNAEENKEKKTLALIMPTAFIKSYINQHYGDEIEKLCQEFGIRASYLSLELVKP